MTDRICWHGHRVTDASATSCPLCGVSMDNARLAREAEVRRYDKGVPGADRSWNWIGAGMLLSLLGLVIELASDEDAGLVIGSILLGLGGLAFLIGGVGIGVFNGMLDYDARKEAVAQRSRPSDEP